jgi:hypothetical protein
VGVELRRLPPTVSEAVAEAFENTKAKRLETWRRPRYGADEMIRKRKSVPPGAGRVGCYPGLVAVTIQTDARPMMEPPGCCQEV